MLELSNLKIVLETVGKIKKAFEGLKSSKLFIKEIDVYDLVEKHFSLEQLPKGKIKLKGRLSNYTLSNNFPIYTPAHLKAIKQTSQKEFSLEHKRFLDKYRLELQTKALNVPSITHKPIELPDKSAARILWLYREDSEGLVFDAVND